MLFSSKRKRALSGWLREHCSQEFWSALKLQKFLFFYEAISKIDGETSEFQSLKGYINGPVFSDVYGDFTYRITEFLEDIERSYYDNTDIINEETAKLAAFLVKILNEQELSDLTHEFNVWKKKQKEIENGERNVRLLEEDLDEEDKTLLISLKGMYPSEYIDSVEVIQISGKSFIISNEDYSTLTEEQRFTFFMLANQEELENPVYVSISESGVLLVD